MVTIADVARYAGVSVATVSRVINGSDKVTEKTKEKIEKAIAEIGYRPNALGRNLRRMNTNTILVILPTIANSFFSKLVKGIEDTGRKKGYAVMLCTTEENPDSERMYLDLIRMCQADGAILLSSYLSDEELNQFGKAYPLVQCSEYRENVNLPYVSIDNVKAAYDSVSYLTALGHRKIALISESNSYSSRLREIGYEKALKEASVKERYIEYGNYGYTSGYRAMERLLCQCPSLSAVFAISDIMAVGAIKACVAHGKRVPEDISVIGFDNIIFSRMFTPELTTVSQPRYQLGENAMNMLITRLETGKYPSSDQFLNHELIIRQSTKKVL